MRPGTSPAFLKPALSSHALLVLAPVWELTALFLLVLFYAAQNSPNVSQDSYSLPNTVGPLLLIAILATSSFKAVLKRGVNLWACLLWFRIATAVYFGVGSLAPEFVNLVTLEYLEVFYAARADQIFRVNLLTAVSTLTVLASARLVLMALRPPRAPNAVNERELLWTAIIFAAIGFSIKLLVVVPYTLGVLDAQVVPGALLSLDLLAPVSIYLMMRYSTLAKPAWLPAVMGLTAIEVAIGVLLFNKSEIVITIIMFVMGYLSRGITLLRGAVSLAAIFVVFDLAVPVTDYGRVEAPQHYGELGGTFSQRLQLLQSYFSAAPELVAVEKVQGTYVRLSYVHAAAFAMNLPTQVCLAILSNMPGPSPSRV